MIIGNALAITQHWWSIWLTILTNKPQWDAVSIFKSSIFKLVINNSSMVTLCKIVLKWMPRKFINIKSTLVQEMAWCRQASWVGKFTLLFASISSHIPQRSLAILRVTRSHGSANSTLYLQAWMRGVSSLFMGINRRPVLDQCTWKDLVGKNIQRHATHTIVYDLIVNNSRWFIPPNWCWQ